MRVAFDWSIRMNDFLDRSFGIIGPLQADLYELDTGDFCLRIFWGDRQLFAVELLKCDGFRIGFEVIGLDSVLFDLGSRTIKWDLPRFIEGVLS